MLMIPLLLLWARRPFCFTPAVRLLLVALLVPHTGLAGPCHAAEPADRMPAESLPAESLSGQSLPGERLEGESVEDQTLVVDRSDAAAPGEEEEGVARESSRPSQEPVSSTRQREGTRLTEMPGRLREVGRRWTFVADDGQSTYRLLENLSLERVARAIQQDPSDDRWTISGELTEYHGENFLLLRRVARTPRSQ